MLEKDISACQILVKKMNAYNDERKEIEARLTEDALAQANECFSNKSAVVVCGKGDAWNPGVVGIVAGKMANSLGKTMYRFGPS